jgi:hypothetical protein
MMRVLLSLFLAGCAAAGVTPVSNYDPDAVTALLKPCAIAEPRAYTTEEATRVANERRASLIRCNADKAKLRELLK